ncbi:secondary thiamine-phosphate synthase enzyme YjbQ [Flammeovirga sp. SJP92]|uniref:secondary thiamine-phosphate synthase enzyme YjbQ n=1 Tax=Flammeovirga sp. SJP92 TaxID=1775430 RepID=UPI0007891F12|nr:secondary thiamine-phosphate synthase enzyme YjbQ [Flammeovirga sp. SJP92]KXX70205.1 hypothetical protein AVL50_15180 [Flammeovirga sp. SJP92]
MVIQKTISLRPYIRGYHIITDEVLDQIPELKGRSGILQVFIQHTSASLTINENADPSVRTDFESHFNKVYPENAPYYEHTYEGADDMPAHLKASTLGSSVSLPIGNGRPLLGTWQGIYLGEHRNRGGSRRLVLTFIGE